MIVTYGQSISGRHPRHFVRCLFARCSELGRAAGSWRAAPGSHPHRGRGERARVIHHRPGRISGRYGSSAREIEISLEEQPDEDGLREGIETPQDDPREGVSHRRLHDGGRQVTDGEKTHPAERPRLEIGGVPPTHVRRRGHRRLGLHRQERMLKVGGYRKSIFISLVFILNVTLKFRDTMRLEITT